ncbi:MAG: hypothetical protein QMD92_00205 [bacterium]|nr:hypothetical protein [bacterium]
MKPSEMLGLKKCVGKKYGKLTVVGYYPYPDGKGPRWICKCNCGKDHIVRAIFLKRGDVKSCGCIASENAKPPKLEVGEAAKNSTYLQYKLQAAKRDFDFTLTFEEFVKLVSLSCYYCGRPPSNIKRGHNGDFIYQGIDRENSEIGYTRSNSVPCCKTCNMAKGTMSHIEFIAHIIRMYKYSVEDVRRDGYSLQS